MLRDFSRMPNQCTTPTGSAVLTHKPAPLVFKTCKLLKRHDARAVHSAHLQKSHLAPPSVGSVTPPLRAKVCGFLVRDSLNQVCSSVTRLVTLTCVQKCNSTTET